MSFSERLQRAWDSLFRKVDGLELPSEGRSSRETLGGSLSTFLTPYGSVSPIINFEMLKALKTLWLYNPDFSQFVDNMQTLGNPGHQVSIEARSESAIAAAIARLDETAVRIYPNACGVDGLIGQYLSSVAWSGAISSEDVVNIAAGRVEKVVLVPVEQIRFKYNRELDRFEPYQRTTGIFGQRDGIADPAGLVRLNDETYKYFALSTVENSPYAKPPATAAVEAILKGQVPIMENIQNMAQKIGLMGLISASVVAPSKRPTETDGEHAARATTYLRNVRDRLSDFKNGLIVTFRDQKIEHTPVTTGASGVYDVNRISEEQVASGMNIQPVFLGRTDSSTETFADVVYEQLKAKFGGMQRIVKRRMEQTYRLDVRLGGIDVDRIIMSFNKAHSRNALAEAEAEQVKFNDTLARVKSGAIDPDEGAQELGYDSWADPELLFSQTGIAPPAAGSLNRSFQKSKGTMITLRYDTASQKYRYKPERIELTSGWEANEDGGGSVVPFIKKKALHAGA